MSLKQANRALPADLCADDLHEKAAELAGLIGLPALLRLVERWGGLHLYVPERIREDHPLAAVIGIDAARKLSEVYGRDVIPVPACKSAVNRARDRLLRALYRDHAWPAHRIAWHTGLTERHVWRILAASDDTGPDLQARLF